MSEHIIKSWINELTNLNDNLIDQNLIVWLGKHCVSWQMLLSCSEKINGFINVVQQNIAHIIFVHMIKIFF